MEGHTGLGNQHPNGLRTRGDKRAEGIVIVKKAELRETEEINGN